MGLQGRLGPTLDEQLPNQGHLFVRSVRFTPNLINALTLISVGPGVGLFNQGIPLALPKIGIGGFAGGFRVTEGSQKVVSKLKGYPEGQGDLGDVFDIFIPRTDDGGARGHRSDGGVARGFMGGHFER
jgi:hypothetical protein